MEGEKQLVKACEKSVGYSEETTDYLLENN